MKQKSLILLSLVTAAVLIAAVVSQRSEPSTGAVSPVSSGPFFDNLLDRINEVARIEISSGDEELVIAKRADDWVLETTGGYPAKFEVVKAALVGLAELEKSEGKTSDAKHYSALGVDQESIEQGGSTRVLLQDASGATLAGIILGNRKTGRAPLRFVRDPDAEQVWLVSGRVNIRTDSGSWMEKQFANIEQDRVASVTILRGEEAPLRVYKDRPDDANFLVEGLPEERELVSPSIANSLAAGLSFLSLEEVLPVDSFDFEAGRVSEATIRTWDGLVITVETTQADGAGWIRVKASTDTPPVPLPEPLPEPDAEGEEHADHEGHTDHEGHEDHAEPAEQAESLDYDKTPGDEVIAEAEELNSTLGPWAYKVAAYKLASFEKSMEDLLRAPVIEESAEPDAPAAAFDALSIEDALDGDMSSFEDLMNADQETLDPETKEMLEGLGYLDDDGE